MKAILSILLISFSTLSFSQVDTTENSYEWKYSMPILGKKAAARGYKIQLPYGLNVNYVYNRMDLEITAFGMTIGDDPNSTLNQLIAEHVTTENLNFTNTIARTNGMNIRADFWLFPFINFYGLYSNNSGSTEVAMQPEWHDEEGNLVLSLPEIRSKVDFSANTYGLGTTIVGKIHQSYFFSVDGNVSWSYSELLNKPAVLSVFSARVGDRIKIGKKSVLAIYVGGMYRGFIDNEGNYGAIEMQQALPNLGSELFPAIDARIEANNEEIASLNPDNPVHQKKIETLERKNEILGEINTAFESLISSDVNYGIKKDIKNNWSVQFGLNFEINKNLTIRGEFGKGTGNDFILTGIQYRFGI